MRTILCILLLAPGLGFASPYKCVVAGETTYSEYPCGAGAAQVPNRLSGIGDASPAQAASAAAASASKLDSGGTSSPVKTASGQLGVTERKADCQARFRQYQESLACFAPYWHGTHLDVEAYSHCTEVKQPTDCSIDEMK